MLSSSGSHSSSREDEQPLSLSLGKVGLVKEEQGLRRVGPEACEGGGGVGWGRVGWGGVGWGGVLLPVPQPVRSRWLVPMGSQWGRG